jgi:hypothetical protein
MSVAQTKFIYVAIVAEMGRRKETKRTHNARFLQNLTYVFIHAMNGR